MRIRTCRSEGCPALRSRNDSINRNEEYLKERRFFGKKVLRETIDQLTKERQEFLAMIQEGGKCPGLIVLETPISRIASVRHEMCGIEFVEAETELLEREAEAITKYAGE